MRGNNLGFVVVMVMMIVDVQSTNLHKVGGGRFTWRPNIDFSDWARHENFYVGEWLYFGFDPTKHNVLQVNKSSYEGCIDTDFISDVTRGGRDVFHLNESKTYYFICSRGYCHRQSMKLAVNVLLKPTTSSTSTAPTASTATTLNIPSNAIPAVATAILTLIFGFIM